MAATEAVGQIQIYEKLEAVARPAGAPAMIGEMLERMRSEVRGSGTVADRLLREIALVLKQHDASADDHARARKWEEWAAPLNFATTMPAAVPNNPGAVLMLAGLAAVFAPSLVKYPALELSVQIVGGVLLAIGATLAASATLAERAAALFKARAQRRERTLDARKDELRAVMAKRERQLVHRRRN